MIGCLVVLGVLPACDEDLLDQEPRTILAPDILFQDSLGFETGLNGLYERARRERGGNSESSVNSLFISLAVAATDNCYINRTTNFLRVLQEWGSLNNPGNIYYERIFDWLYDIVGNANLIISRVQTTDALSGTSRARVEAEARFFRAWAYRHLTYLFGDVPLLIEEADGGSITNDVPRDPLSSIHQIMLGDFEFAAENLPYSYGNGEFDDAKVNRGTAQHYLAEHLVLLGENQRAVTVAQDLVNNGPFSLVTERYGPNASNPGTPFTDMFVAGQSNRSDGNTETLWTFQLEFETIGGEGNNAMRRSYHSDYGRGRPSGFGIAYTADRGGRGQTRLSPTTFQFNLYERDPLDSTIVFDDRGGPFAYRYFFIYKTIDDIPDGSSVGDTIFMYEFMAQEPLEEVDRRKRPFTRKWDNIASPDDPILARSYNDQIYLRLAETYLVLAEAQVKIGDAAGAATTINALRDRANASRIAAVDVDIDFVLDERARELYAEEHRRYALLRNGKWFERTQLHNGVSSSFIVQRDTIFPLPQAFFDNNTNPNVQNNPGY